MAIVLSFLQHMFDMQRALSTIKVYACVISACHESFGGASVFSHLLVKHFVRDVPVSVYGPSHSPAVGSGLRARLVV